MSDLASLELHRKWGFWGVVAGAVGLVAVFYQIAAPMMEPAPSVGTQIGEIAGEMRRAAWDSFLGRETAAPEPVAAGQTIMAYLIFIGPALGCLALVLALVSGLRGEDRRLPAYGTGLGVAAITFQFIWLVAALIVGAMLLVAIMKNMGSIFGGDIFGG